MILSSWKKPNVAKVHSVRLTNADIVPKFPAKLKTRPTDLGCKSAGRLVPSTSTCSTYYYTAQKHIIQVLAVTNKTCNAEYHSQCTRNKDGHSL